MKSLRNKCIICDSDKLDTIIKLQDMPVFMGVNKGQENLYSDMTFVCCANCNTVQIQEIIDPDILYQDNHNTAIVGKTWIDHYMEFAKFIGDNVNSKTILEIGDPSCKISSLLSNNVNKWFIVEINPDEKIKVPLNVEFIKSFFDKKLFEDKKIDCVIHSHLLEHITNPIEHLNDVHNIIEDNGLLIFSVPNLEMILNSGQSPNGVLHFEHTYFFSEINLKRILKYCGFDCIKTQYYNNHSIFFMCKKVKKDILNITDIEISNKFISSRFLNSFTQFKNKVNDINQALNNNKNSKIYLYGAHISSQFLINIGLDIKNISNILDNSDAKIDYPLYGTNLLTKHPSSIILDENPIVIVSHMSIYKNEIIKQLKELNENIIFL